ncbi:MAG: Pyrrolo-quinoline quinone repeat-containing protein [Acidimicrobiales bacterium]|jgi:polyvinyl alcohol dehydrogenase (cytochrome)|nr:Pyrrolo-quinoline quinone repeat-containing protein [Acidimicrobiales bacterium]
MRGGRIAVAGTLAVALAAMAAPVARATAPQFTIGPSDWRAYGHDAQHTFAGTSTLTADKARLLSQRWFFATGDAVTANPIVVGGTVYVGSWDGHMYAIDAGTGAKRWSFAVKRQASVHPNPDGRALGDVTSDGGLITSAAWFEPAGQWHPPMVIFGGGFTLYALDATNGHLVWAHDLTGRPDLAPDPAHDETRVFSSPVVVDSKVIVGVSPDGQSGHRGYVAGVDLLSGAPAWRFETDVDASGTILNDGCGGVWASPTVDAVNGTVIEDVADCNFYGNRGGNPYNERVLALRAGDGSLVWRYTPKRLATSDPKCDYDFGATSNLGTGADGRPFLGVGGKDGTYYALDPATGAERWETNVVFGGLAGGFIGTTAFDGHRVYGATALGDFGRFEGFGQSNCFGDPRDTMVQEPSVHAFDAVSGKVVWQGALCQSFGPTAVAGGLVFVGCGISREVQIRDAATGTLVNAIPIPAPSDSGMAVVKDTVFFGTGSSEQGSPAGVYAFAPLR